MNIIIFQIVALILSAIIHEYMHGWAAFQLGDNTAKDAGRLTLNPIPHIDPIGSIVLPAFLVLSGMGIVFGWAKPVPYNPYNLRDQKYGGAKVAIAGPMANLLTAIVFGLILRFVPISNSAFMTFLAIIVQVNLLLMIFNLVPLPPLDGSKVLMPFLPYNLQVQFAKLEQYGMFLVILFIWVGFPLILPIIEFMYKLILGI